MTSTQAAAPARQIYMVALDGPIDAHADPALFVCVDEPAPETEHPTTLSPGEEYSLPDWGCERADELMHAIGAVRSAPWRRTWVPFLGSEAWAARVAA